MEFEKLENQLPKMEEKVELTFFPDQSDFRVWLEKFSEVTPEIYVGFYKVKSGKKSMTWSESVDQALCFGWIDGLRKGVDNESYFIRFTPRNPRSIWSIINIRKVEALTQQGLMKPQGLTLFDLRKEHKSGIYTYETEPFHLIMEYELKFRVNKLAWNFFISLPPSYHKPAIKWVMSAKQEVTRLKRLNELITQSEFGRKIKSLNY